MKSTSKNQIANPKATGYTARMITDHIVRALQAHGLWQALYQEKLNWPELQDAAEYNAVIDEMIATTNDIIANLEIARSMGR